jgi:hypothetical protein
MERLKSTLLKTLLIGITTALFPVTTQAAPTTFSIDMSVNPLDSGWGLYSSNGGSSFSSDGILTVNSTGYYELVAPTTWVDSVNTDLGWSLETRMRVVSGNAGVWIYDNPGLKLLSFLPDKAGLLYPANAYATVDTTIFHDYRFEALGNRVSMYVDGVHMFDQYLTFMGGGSSVFTFGDLGAIGSFSKSEWDYLNFTFEPSHQTPVPEPSAAYLLISGLFVLWVVLGRKSYLVAENRGLSVTHLTS